MKTNIDCKVLIKLYKKSNKRNSKLGNFIQDIIL